MTSHGADYCSDVGDDVDMKPFTNSNIHTSTIDSSSGAHRYAGNTEQFPSEYGSHPLMRIASKGKTAKKKTKGEEDDGRSQADEDEIDVDRYVNMESTHVSVKILRKIIPKLRIACYFSDEQMSGKRKFKHLWDERPSDWPQHIPFKDPNNAVKDARKPGKDELGPMFTFLKLKYLEQKTNRGRLATDSEHVHSSNWMSLDVFAGHGASVQPTDNQMMYAREDSKQWPWQWQQPQQQQLSEEHAVLVPTRTEQLPHDVQQSMLTGLVSQHVPVNGSVALRTEAVLPAPVRDIYQRLVDKQLQVASMSSDSEDVTNLLNDVQREVINELYKNLSPPSESTTRLCLMFIDAAHQYEALLDVLLILGQIDIAFLRSGCDELIKKFNKECLPVMMLHSFYLPTLPRSIFGSSLPVVGAGDQQYVNTGNQTAVNSTARYGDIVSDCGPADQPVDVSVYGINLKTCGPYQHFMSNLIEKRPEMLPTLSDDDDDAMKKLLDRFYEEQDNEQRMKDGETEQQMMTGMGDTVTAMDCSESQMLNDVVEIISSDIAQSPHSCFEDSSTSRLTTEPLSLSSNAESSSYTGAASSGQWSLPAGMESLWSSCADVSLSSLTGTDQHFTCSQTQFDCHEFQSLPNVIATDSRNVHWGQVEPCLSLGSQRIGSNAENFLLSSNPTLASEADDVACSAILSASASHAVQNVAPIPAFVSNASYDDFDMDETNQRGYRRIRSPRGSVSNVRSGKEANRIGKTT